MEYPKDWNRASSFVQYKDSLLLSFDLFHIYEIDLKSGICKVLIEKNDYPNIVNKFGFIEIIQDTLFAKTSDEIIRFDISDNYNLLGVEKIPYQTYIYAMIAQSDKIYLWTQEGLIIRSSENEYRLIDTFNSKYLLKNKGPIIPERRGEDEIIFGTSFQGVIIFNTKTEQTKVLNKDLGTRSNKITRAISDDQGNIWGLSAAGLMVYNNYSGRFGYFQNSEGLIDDDLIHKRLLYLPPGKIVLSQNGGIQILDFSEITMDSEGISPIIYAINGENINNKKEWSYSHSEDHLNFWFSNFDFGNSSRYEYNLNDKGWQDISTPGELSLVGLSSGSYILRIRGTDMYGRLAYSEKVYFNILFPWWQKWWVQLLALFLFTAMAIWIFYLINKPKQKLKKVETEYQDLTKELENQVLRAQMNPHFLFNSLNSIRYYIVNKDSKMAANYLTKFSRLIRLILEHSAEKLIPLSSEMDMIRLYIQMELIRFEGKFEFVESLDLYSDIESVFIPPMIIQPFLENAIIHGINAKQTKAKLWLNIKEKDQFLRIEIIDNGIGRKKSVALKSKNQVNNKSLGMSITAKRLKMISEQFPSAIHISDWNNDIENPGTQVTIEIYKQIHTV